MEKISQKKAQEYISRIGVTGINLDGYLYANPNTSECFSDKNTSGLLIRDGNHCQLHSQNKEFLKEAYDFVSFGTMLGCVEHGAAKFLRDCCGAQYDEYCHILSYTKPTAPSFEKPQNLTLKAIDLKDLDIIDGYYTYRGPESKARLFKEITSRPSSALYDGDKIIAWNLLHSDMSMGVMFVPPEHRGKGYAYVVAADLISKVLAMGKTPYIQVVNGNTASLSLAAKLGFEKIFEACWLHKEQTV